jgi:hypothetical protein
MIKDGFQLKDLMQKVIQTTPQAILTLNIQFHANNASAVNGIYVGYKEITDYVKTNE